MDLSDDSYDTAGGGLSPPCARCHTESGGNIMLELLEFKTHLLEAVEELHIRRDAETRFVDQISKLALEKQELEWEKESLQHVIKTATNERTETLIDINKQLQAKIRNTEEEKGKYQVSAELKDKEINNLKEELKSLQLLKYNLEKKSSELEQKLALQSRSKDIHLKQLGEVEKRFSALSRQCAMVKQAHEKLEQNVDEAMKINKKLTTANGKQEAIIASLKKELEEVSHKLIKAKMSSVQHNKAQSPPGREQQIQQLHQKLNMETEMNKKLREETVAVRAEKQGVMKSLQHAQQLLLSQTQTVSRVELELQTHREQYQALKQEHSVMREKSKAAEDKVAKLMESYAASRNSWDKEKSMFLDRINSELQNVQAVKDVYDELHQEHAELSSKAKVQAQHIYELEMRDDTQSLRVSQVFPAALEEIRREETLNEPTAGSEQPGLGILQHLASTQTRNPDCLEDTGAVTELVDTGATGVSSPGHRSIDGSVDLLSKEQNEEGNGGIVEKVQDWNDCGKHINIIGQQGERREEQQWKGEEVRGEDAKEGTLVAQTTDRADRREDSQGSAEDAADPKQPETETKDSAEAEGEGAEKRGEAETQIPAQTTADTTAEKSDTQQVVDFIVPPPAACEPSESLSQKVSEKNEGYEIKRADALCSDERQSASHGPSAVVQEVQRLGHDEVQREREKPPNEPETDTELSGPLNPDNTSLEKQMDDDVKEEDAVVRTMQALPQRQEISEQSGQLKSDEDGGSSAYKKGEVQPNVETCEKDACKTGSSQDHMTNDKTEDAGDAKTTDLKLSVHPSHESDASPETDGAESHELKKSPAEEMLLDATNELSLPSNKTHRLSFELGSAPRKAVTARATSDVSILHQFVQGSHMSEQTTSEPLRQPSTIPMFLKSKPNKVPLVISGASDLLNASSVSGTAASSRRHQQGELRGKAPGETCRETATADTESRASPSFTSFPVSSSTTVSRLPWQTATGCSRAPASAARPSSESDWELSCSQEREDQQTSFRAQISEIEQFLNTQRLRLSKRRKTNN